MDWFVGWLVGYQTFYLTQSQYTDTGPPRPSTDPIMPGAWQGSHWYDSTRKKSCRKRDLNPGSSAPEADALTTRPTRRSTWWIQTEEIEMFADHSHRLKSYLALQSLLLPVLVSELLAVQLTDSDQAIGERRASLAEHSYGPWVAYLKGVASFSLWIVLIDGPCKENMIQKQMKYRGHASKLAFSPHFIRTKELNDQTNKQSANWW